MWSSAGQTPDTSATRTNRPRVLARRGAMGCQVHAARSLSAGDLLVRIPLALALSHSRASRLPVGRAVAAFVKRRYRPALFPQLSRKAVARGAMLMVMIANRCAGVGPWREYVHTLPDSFDDALWWPPALVNALPQVSAHQPRSGGHAHIRARVQKLELGREVASHRQLVSATFAFFFPSLWDAHPSLFPRQVTAHLTAGTTAKCSCAHAQVFTAAAWRWANSVYSSRAFPESWARATHADGPGGVMLPLVDMLNHRDGAPVQWRAKDGHFELRTTAAVGAGQQVFNDYGKTGSVALRDHAPGGSRVCVVRRAAIGSSVVRSVRVPGGAPQWRASRPPLARATGRSRPGHFGCRAAHATAWQRSKSV